MESPDPRGTEQDRVFTIGYGGRSKEELLDLLKSNAIRTVVDVRLRPDRASMGLWTKAKTSDRGIARVLSDAEIGYHSLVELGNVYVEDADWHTKYSELMVRAGDLLTVRLRQIDRPFALLCSEKHHSECHRTIIAEWLVAHNSGMIITHL